MTVHWNAPQFEVVAFWQAPTPSQLDAEVNVVPLHDAGAHWWLVPTLRQAPLPSQVPSFPHGLVAVSSTQLLWGSSPLEAGAQVPSDLPVNA